MFDARLMGWCLRWSERSPCEPAAGDGGGVPSRGEPRAARADLAAPPRARSDARGPASHRVRRGRGPQHLQPDGGLCPWGRQRRPAAGPRRACRRVRSRAGARGGGPRGPRRGRSPVPGHRRPGVPAAGRDRRPRPGPFRVPRRPRRGDDRPPAGSAVPGGAALRLPGPHADRTQRPGTITGAEGRRRRPAADEDLRRPHHHGRRVRPDGRPRHGTPEGAGPATGRRRP